jgi:putative transposase
MHAHPALQPGQFYHVFNRGNNRETLFRTPDNYRHFLRLYAHHVHPACTTLAFCLLPNHFHLLVRIRDDSASRGASQALSNLCNAYTKAFNRRYGRSGALFARPFHRKPVETTRYLAAVVRYIHRNPEHHGLISDFQAWPFSSWPLVATNSPTRLDRRSLLDLCGGPAGLRALHALDAPVPEALYEPDFDALTDADLRQT